MFVVVSAVSGFRLMGIFVVSDLCKTKRSGNAAGTWVSLALTSSIDAQGCTSMPNVRLVSVLTRSCIPP
jgi:hypothetical protein